MMRQFPLCDGRTLSYREAGEGRPLVLVHGWSMSSAVFDEVLQELGADYRVLAPDLRGHGASAPGAAYALADFAGDLAEWMDGLELADAVLLGWSLGGMTCLEAYPALGRRVRQLVLVGTTPRFAAASDWEHGLPEGQIRSMARNLRRNYHKTMGDFFSLQFAPGETSRERGRAIIEFAVREGSLPEPAVAAAALETLRTADLREQLDAVACPVLIIQGEADPITRPGAAAWLAENLSQARLELIPGVGHAPFLSRPELVFGLLREVLQ